MKITTPHTAGFTLIEMIVSLALFATVSTVAVGSLLVLIDNNRELRGEQSLITNVSFALDMMARDIRTGFDYVCETMSSAQNNRFYQLPGSGPGNQMTGHAVVAVAISGGSGPWNGASQTCASGWSNVNRQHIISFVEGRSRVSSGQDERRAYILESDNDGGIRILRRKGDEDAQSIISESINITDADFIVTGADRQDGNQPTVTIILEVETDDGAEFTVQTTVTQRFLDI